MSNSPRFKLFVMMLLEFFIWGAWVRPDEQGAMLLALYRQQSELICRLARMVDCGSCQDLSWGDDRVHI